MPHFTLDASLLYTTLLLAIITGMLSMGYRWFTRINEFQQETARMMALLKLQFENHDALDETRFQDHNHRLELLERFRKS